MAREATKEVASSARSTGVGMLPKRSAERSPDGDGSMTMIYTRNKPVARGRKAGPLLKLFTSVGQSITWWPCSAVMAGRVEAADAASRVAMDAAHRAGGHGVGGELRRKKRLMVSEGATGIT